MKRNRELRPMVGGNSHQNCHSVDPDVGFIKHKLQSSYDKYVQSIKGNHIKN